MHELRYPALFQSCTQSLISLCTICHACYFVVHVYKSLALCLNCFWETPHFNSVWVLFSFSWITYSFYCCSVSNILFLPCWYTVHSSENYSFSSFSASREHFIDDIHPLKLITASEKDTEKYTAGTCICWVCSHAYSFYYYETFKWIFVRY